ncbi:c-type cytochrome biogenesis protein CcmI [Caenispirillum bisanense]|uniref:c-type cytochrome biogenesis protein CcmI n=1 Tax=Caenispirillum bisanense TaxID=414052 RepID=UPI0031E1A0C0
MAFWIALALLTAAVLLLLVLPLLRRPKGPVDQVTYDLAVYKDQLSEVERDRERGLLTDDQAVAARLEIERRILAMAPDVPAAKGKGKSAKAGKGASQIGQPVSGAARLAALLSVVLVPVGGIVMYLGLGTPGLPDQPYSARQEVEQHRMAQQEEMVQLAQQLAARLEADPDNPEGWAMLGRSWSALGRYADAVKAFEQAVRRQGDSDTWAALGEAHVAMGRGEVTRPAATAFRNSLRGNRDDARSRYYLGLYRYQQDDVRGAIAIWRDLQDTSPADAPWLPMVRDSIAEVASLSGVDAGSVTPSHPLDMPELAPAPGAGAARPQGQAQAPSAGDLAAAEADAGRAQAGGGGFTAEEREMVQTMVDGLAERLRESPDDYAGWMRLGQSYLVLQRPLDAAEAYGNAVRLQPENPEALRNLANAQALTAKEQGLAQPPAAFYDTLRRILAVDPNDPAALKLVGEQEAAAGNADTARTLWLRLRDLLPEGSADRAEVEQRLQSLGS